METLTVDVPKARLLFSQRWVLAVMACFGNLFVYVVRVNLSVAIICMVRSDNVTLGEVSSYSSNVTTVTLDANDDCEAENLDTSGENYRGEFDWDKSTGSRLLSMYFYGYIFTQILGGWLASKYGGKRVWGVCQFISALCSLATPICARTSVYLTYALRFLLGFVAGVTFPCVHSLLGRWAPPYERSKMATYTFGGPLVGNVLTWSISGVLCDYGFDNGWGSIFYLSGIFNLIWLILWFKLIADRPEQHKRITPTELEYIQHSIGQGAIKKISRVPWGAMLRSRPLWALTIVHSGSNYTFYTLLTSLPTFMKESLKFDIKQNGALSSLPYVTQLLFTIVVGFSADTIRERRWLTTKSVRKIFQCSSLAGAAFCLIFVGQLNCTQRYLAVFFICLCSVFMSGNRAGYSVNHLDLAPSYAGVLFGITNTLGTIPGMIAPLIAGALTPNKTAEEWSHVFYVCAGVALTTAIIYLLLADGELQMWARPDFYKPADVEVTYNNPTSMIVDDDTESNGVDDVTESNGVDDVTAYNGVKDAKIWRDLENMHL